MANLTIGMPVFEGVDMLDIVGPTEVFTWMNTTWPGNTVKVLLVAEDVGVITTGSGVRILPDVTFEQCPAIDVLILPGGDTGPVKKAIASKPLMDFVRERGKTAKWVCSVCTGALILSAAGLLDGYHATTHWAALGSLRANPAVRVVNGYPRYVLDGNRVTGGGISSGLDASLALTRLFSGDPNVERRTQLMIQYHPQPDYDSGDPDVADSFTLASLLQLLSGNPPAPPAAEADAVPLLLVGDPDVPATLDSLVAWRPDR